MSRPQKSPLSSLKILLVISVVIETGFVSSFPRERRQFFTTCWGWGAGCSMHSAVGRALKPATSSNGHLERRRPAKLFIHKDRYQVGIPSIVTSGGWEPGVMGKRTGLTEHLFTVLERRKNLVANSHHV